MEKSWKNRRAVASIVFRAVALAAGIGGIILHMSVNSLLTTGFMVKHNLAYFTLQTNIFSTVLFGVLLLKSIIHWVKHKEAEIAYINPTLHFACTMYITITMVVYWLVLTPITGLPQNTVLWMDGLCLHALTPILAILDSLFFAKHGKVQQKAIPKLLIYPILYYISVVIVAHLIKEPYYTLKLNGKVIELLYPYPFLDPQLMGFGGVAIAVAVAVLAFILFAMLYIGLDKKIAKHMDK